MSISLDQVDPNVLLLIAPLVLLELGLLIAAIQATIAHTISSTLPVSVSATSVSPASTNRRPTRRLVRSHERSLLSVHGVRTPNRNVLRTVVSTLPMTMNSSPMPRPTMPAIGSVSPRLASTTTAWATPRNTTTAMAVVRYADADRSRFRRRGSIRGTMANSATMPAVMSGITANPARAAAHPSASPSVPQWTGTC